MKTDSRKNNIIKGKAKYKPSEPFASPINTAENCARCPCGENSQHLAEFAAEHTPNKTYKKPKKRQ